MGAATRRGEAEAIESIVSPVDKFSRFPGFFGQKTQKGKMQNGAGAGMKTPMITKFGMTVRGMREPDFDERMAVGVVELSESMHVRSYGELAMDLV